MCDIHRTCDVHHTCEVRVDDASSACQVVQPMRAIATCIAPELSPTHQEVLALASSVIRGIKLDCF